MELVILGVVTLALAVFFLWPKVSEKIDDFQEDMDKAHEKVEKAFDEAVEKVEEAKDELQEAIANLPTVSQLKKLTKAKIEELGREVGIELDRRQTKDNMIKELNKEVKAKKQ
jgi:F0F1-type ATP synthase membrane subunit b/b'